MMRSILARAGEPASVRIRPISSRVYPRPCGGAPAVFDRVAVGGGLSPPVRGSPHQYTTAPPDDRSIPARAGEPPGDAAAKCAAGVYPRPCGGAMRRTPASVLCTGLSPPVRGSRPAIPGRVVDPGSIPARAGEPMHKAQGLNISGVYPRPCGGADHLSTLRVDVAGLSPPVRGSRPAVPHSFLAARSIPARAGEPWCLATCRSLTKRSIPARAGEPACWSWSSTWPGVYPRPCGGASSAPSRMSVS